MYTRHAAFPYSSKNDGTRKTRREKPWNGGWRVVENQQRDYQVATRTTPERRVSSSWTTIVGERCSLRCSTAHDKLQRRTCKHTYVGTYSCVHYDSIHLHVSGTLLARLILDTSVIQGALQFCTWNLFCRVFYGKEEKGLWKSWWKLLKRK